MAFPLLPLLGLLGSGVGAYLGNRHNKGDLTSILGGAALGGGLGGLGGLLGGSKSGRGFLMGDPGGQQQFPRFTPEQQSTMSELLQQGKQNTDFSGIENLARKNFTEQTIPGLAERFTSMGGGQHSSAFQGALGGAGSDLEAQLAALKPRFGMQQLGMGLQPSFESAYKPATPGFAQTGLSSLMALLPQLLQLYSGGM